MQAFESVCADAAALPGHLGYRLVWCITALRVLLVCALPFSKSFPGSRVRRICNGTYAITVLLVFASVGEDQPLTSQIISTFCSKQLSQEADFAQQLTDLSLDAAFQPSKCTLRCHFAAPWEITKQLMSPCQMTSQSQGIWVFWMTVEHHNDLGRKNSLSHWRREAQICFRFLLYYCWWVFQRDHRITE